MKLRAFKLLLFLLAGAIINVGVALGCAYWTIPGFDEEVSRPIAEAIVFPNGAPPAQNNKRNFASFQSRSFGCASTRIWARWLSEDAQHIYDVSAVYDIAHTSGWPLPT